MKEKKQRSVKRVIAVGQANILVSVFCLAKKSSNRIGAKIVGFDTSVFFIRADLVILGIKPYAFPTLMDAREDEEVFATFRPLIFALGGDAELARRVAEDIGRMVADVRANPEGDDAWHGKGEDQADDGSIAYDPVTGHVWTGSEFDGMNPSDAKRVTRAEAAALACIYENVVIALPNPHTGKVIIVHA